MSIMFTGLAWNEFVSWQDDDEKFDYVCLLIDDIFQNAYEGIGEPKQLEGEMSDYWCRKIDDKNKLIYRVENDTIELYQCRTI